MYKRQRQTLEQVVATDICHIFAHGRKSQNQPGVVGGFAAVEPALLVDLLIHIGDHIVVVACGNFSAAPGQAQHHPLAADGTHGGSVLLRCV